MKISASNSIGYESTSRWVYLCIARGLFGDTSCFHIFLLLRARAGELYSDEFLSREFVSLHINEQQHVKQEAGQIKSMVDHMKEAKEVPVSGSSNASVSIYARKLSLAAGFVKELHNLVVKKKGYKDVQELYDDEEGPPAHKSIVNSIKRIDNLSITKMRRDVQGIFKMTPYNKQVMMLAVPKSKCRQ
ncbi:hypothetical protein L1987_65784 [Smallanthus sonchifolius]|uniref:Uncharacterized protein n=1 Tax=Smallanthus sonchifolius TaxID=185202 RepID=A0ACB9BVA1_9ASTR|nr:hypothetical protein L1987_65784 [Smallanthus sonchifolius]